MAEREVITESKSINLGRIKNKYLIVQILILAGELDSFEEASELLWKCSVRHREFLSTNLSWYSKLGNYGALKELIDSSLELKCTQEARFLIAAITNK